MTVTITLSELSLPRIEFQNESGVKRGYYVHHDQLLSFIQSAANDSVMEEIGGTLLMASPALPQNTVKYSLMTNQSHILFVTAPELSVNTQYHQTKFEQVPFPKLVFAFFVKGQSLFKAYVAVYKDLSLRDSTELFKFPYSNVHTDGQLCYWSNETVKDLVQLQTFHQRWVQEPNNDHLYSQSLTTLNKPLRELFDTYQHKSFDYSILKPLGKTFGEWSNYVTLKN